MKKSTSDTFLVKARECFNQGKFREAQKIIAEIVEAGEAPVEAYFLLANIFHMKGEIGKAIKAFRKVLRMDPNHTDAAISLSVLFNDIGKYEDAKKIFEQANARVKNKSSNSELLEDNHINKKFAIKHYELADLYMTYNRYDDALFEYNKTVGLNPNNLEARIKIAKVYAKKGFMGKAFDELRQLKNEHPDHMPARIALGVLHYGNGNILEAQTEWEKVLAKEPNHPEAGMYINLSKTATETSLS